MNTDRNVTSIVFIDGSLADLQAILSGLDPSVTAMVLDPTQNGIQQMADALVGVSGLNAIHIISHGSSGQINIGAAQLSQDTLDTPCVPGAEIRSISPNRMVVANYVMFNEEPIKKSSSNWA